MLIEQEALDYVRMRTIITLILKGLSRLHPPPENQSLKVEEINAAESQLTEEYKILQTKLDKIGEFKFHVKNWAFTLTLAVLVGGFAAKIPTIAVFVCSVMPSVAFMLIDRRQDILSDVFARRAYFLEETARRNVQAKRRAFLNEGMDEPAMTAFGIAQSLMRQRARIKKKTYNVDVTVYVLIWIMCAVACIGASLRNRDQLPGFALNRRSGAVNKDSETTITTSDSASSSWLWSTSPDVVRENTTLGIPPALPSTHR